MGVLKELVEIKVNNLNYMRLYKYYAVTKRNFETLKNFNFYFARFNQLNDPYELTLSNCEPKELSLLKFQFNNPKNPNGIFCLSERNDNLHMWTQYSEGHNGYVIEFETDEDEEFFNEFNKVAYSHTPPNFHNDMKVRELIYSKSPDSEKELEWRIFGKNEMKKINPFAIKSVIFGYRFPLCCSRTNEPPEDLIEKCKNDIEKLDAYLKMDSLYWDNLLPKHINFYKANLVSNSYSLCIGEPLIKPEIK